MGTDPQHVAYPGAEGSYTEEAAGRLYPSARQSAFATFDLVAAALVADDVDRGVLPIENSLAGLVPDTLAILEEGAVSVVAEVALHIPHCLVGVQGATLETIRVVHSHPMALAQCRSALNGRYERVAASTTSEAARTVAALDDVTVAAIASPLAARTMASRSSPTRSPTTPRTSRASSRSRASRGSITTPTRSGTPRCG